MYAALQDIALTIGSVARSPFWTPLYDRKHKRRGIGFTRKRASKR